jgi:hypothetical protein
MGQYPEDYRNQTNDGTVPWFRHDDFPQFHTRTWYTLEDK